MDLPKSGWKGFIQNWRKDLFAGFVVSLIALPLGLGLAIAAGAPPIAGIIAAVVGGIVVSNLGGSFVSISGPGNGLAVATIAAVHLLGQGNDEIGWLFTMAAIVVSGGVLFILGALRFGSISDYFPSAAVEGMLAAIGLIIISNQIHFMFGRLHPQGETTLELLAEVPQTIAWVFSNGSLFVAIIGISCLLIMVLYSKIRAKVFHLVPAPMWVVLLSILLSFILEWNGLLNLIPKELTIVIPDDLFGQYQPPNFSMIGTGRFWNAVVVLTLVASIETLLSIKGVERLDVYKRRANTNKDLKAHGIATIVSGALGGLSVATVIARSSVNVNNGAVTRASNLFHGVILGLVILFLDELVSKIPLPALSAILVYTGYKLASPKEIVRISKVGWEALAVYLLTLIITISTNIITGILFGIIAALVLQLITTKRSGLILRNVFRPNTLLYLEENGIYVISVKKYANFINYARLRNKLDSIPMGSNIIIDFTLAEFIDHSVMEHLHGYNELHERKGGSVELVGLDDLRAASNHPFAPWVPIMGSKPQKEKVLTSRQKNVLAFAEENNFEFSNDFNRKAVDFKSFNYFSTKTIDVIRNAVVGQTGDVGFKLLDIDYHTGEFIARETLHTSLVILDFEVNVPDFVMHREDVFDKMAAAAGFKDINLEGHNDFSSKFFLQGSNEGHLKYFFNVDLINFFLSNNVYHIESKNGKLLIFEKERLAGISEIKGLVNFAIQLAENVQAQQKIIV